MGPPPFLTLPTSRKKSETLHTFFFHVHLMANMCVLHALKVFPTQKIPSSATPQQLPCLALWSTFDTLQERIPENCKLRRRDRPSPSPSFACWNSRGGGDSPYLTRGRGGRRFVRSLLRQSRRSEFFGASSSLYPPKNA